MTLRILFSVVVFVLLGGVGLMWLSAIVVVRPRQAATTVLAVRGLIRVAMAAAVVLSIWFTHRWAVVALACIALELAVRALASRRLHPSEPDVSRDSP